MKALILAAGYATRLYPLTENTPKPLLKVGGKPMMEHIMKKVEELDLIDEVLVVTNNKFHSNFEQWASSYQSPKKITIVNDGTKSNDDRLGAIGDMHFAVQKHNVDDDLLVIAGDNLFDFSLVDFVAHFKDKQTSTLAVRDLGDPALLAKKLGTVETNEASQIIGFEEKPKQPKTSLAATALYLFTKVDVQELKNLCENNKIPDASGEFIKHLMSKKTVHAFTFKENWYDIGSHEQLAEVRKLFEGR